MPPDNPHKLHLTQNFPYRHITPLASGSLEERDLWSIWFSLWITNVHIKIQWVSSEKLMSLVELLEPPKSSSACITLGRWYQRTTTSHGWALAARNEGWEGTWEYMHMYPLAPFSSQGSFSGWKESSHTSFSGVTNPARVTLQPKVTHAGLVTPIR